MRDLRSRMSSDGRIVIPKVVRQKLGLKTGDLIRFKVSEKGAVTINKVRVAEDDLFAAFSEWAWDEDEGLNGRL